MARMRTIKSTIDYIKQQDPESCVTEWWLRQMVKSGKLRHHMAGAKYLIDIDYLEEYLRNPPEETGTPLEYGRLRQVKA